MAARKKSAGPAVQASHFQKLKLDFPLDTKKVEAIRKCLAKGRLTITTTKVNLATGRLGSAWLYD
jgi:anti-sigma28 factor (negative regulator of flagellin synthesis)